MNAKEGTVVGQFGLADLGQQPPQQEETPVFVQFTDGPDITRQPFGEFLPLAPGQCEAKP